MTQPNPTNDDALAAKLDAEIDRVSWADLMPHANRDVVFLVDRDIALLTAAVAVARDDVARVAAWAERRALARPTPAQRDTWDAAPERAFTCVVVAPYVLAQPVDA